MLLADEISLRVFVSAGDAVQKSGCQLLDEEVIRLRVIGIAYAPGSGRNKAGLPIKINIAGNGKRPRASGFQRLCNRLSFPDE